ncbi:oxidoreductase [Pluralibacter gergoviae]|uniref:NADH:flavin oxidoreductase/NADH oxidase n=1 Tax=Pluralibacter gergoviae TaxID=61647 RepID=UPI0005ECC836|nr:NADH:flavin oxidoreductase/NADH oxidase [Pluralibacter gergoviae]KJM66006.1 oxidoreductase [Pluralibacter gergoviae]OUQ96915.1 oxidoreductase [Pluralibacter gergoviae]
MTTLFSPQQLGPLTLANRIVVPPMSQYSAGFDGIVTPWHAQHIGRLAISGAGMVIVEANGVAPEGRITPHCLGLWNDDQRDAARALLTDLRSYSRTPVGVQLNHAGRKAGTNPPWRDGGKSLENEEGGWPTVAPSAIAWKPGWRIPEEITEAQMAKVVDDFVAAGRRAREAGYDFAELHAANGYLLSQFLSPLSNRRTDRYGGSAENRMRFPLQVARALRESWPRDRPLGVRFNGGEFAEGGLALEEAVAFARELHALGYDYLHLSGGYNIYNQQPPADRPGYMVPFAAAVKEALPDAVVITVGLIYQPQLASEIVASGKADLVAVGRGILDDPNWPIHAAIALGETPPWPRPYDRFGAQGWPTHRRAEDA